MKVEENELLLLKNLKLEVQKLKIIYADLLLESEEIDNKIKKTLFELKESIKTESQYLNILADKYGEVEINLETGEIK